MADYSVEIPTYSITQSTSDGFDDDVLIKGYDAVKLVPVVTHHAPVAGAVDAEIEVTVDVVLS